MGETISGKLQITNSNESGTAVMLNGDAKPQTGLGKKPTAGAVPVDPSFITGQLDLKDANGKVLISFSFNNLTSSAVGTLAIIDLFNAISGKSQVQLSSIGHVVIRGEGRLLLGNDSEDGIVELASTERSLTLNGPRGRGTIKLAGGKGEISVAQGLRFAEGALRLGSEPDKSGHAGVLLLRDGNGAQTMELNAENKVLHVRDMLRLENGTLRVGSEPGGSGPAGKILVRNSQGDATIELDGKAGDILLHNADCAEDFDIAGNAVAPGTVMVLTEDGRLRPSSQAYDRRVAGVISGAGEYKPGLVLDARPGLANRQPLALIGKAYCWVDAAPAAVAVGDMLTTSCTPGHAMKATEPANAFGAVIGKALQPLAEGKGLIAVLVTLQ